jgi:hypothetical protein
MMRARILVRRTEYDGKSEPCVERPTQLTCLRSGCVIEVRWDIITPICPQRYHPDQDNEMPTLFRLIFVASALTAVVFGGLYVLATRYEPEQQTISKPVTGVKIRR